MQLAKCNRRSIAMLRHRPPSTSAIPPSSFNIQLQEAMTCHDMINPSMWLHRIHWQPLRYYDFSWAASAVLMQSKLKQWKQQQTTANLGIDKSGQWKRCPTWRHDDRLHRLRHLMAWSMMIYLWHVIWCDMIGQECPSSPNASSKANETLCVGLCLGCGQTLAGNCNIDGSYDIRPAEYHQWVFQGKWMFLIELGHH